MKVMLNKYEPKEIIKFIRQSTGLTQEQFAKEINKSKDTVQSYELGRITMSFNDFAKLCEIFDVKVTIEKKD